MMMMMMMMVYDGRGRLQARGELNLLPVGRMVVLADENQGEQLCPTNRLFTFADLCRRHQKTSLVDDSKKTRRCCRRQRKRRRPLSATSGRNVGRRSTKRHRIQPTSTRRARSACCDWQVADRQKFLSATLSGRSAWKKFDPSRHAFQSHSRSSKPTRIDPPPMTTY